MKALGSLQRVSIRVLSPRILPLLFSLLGSIARTASLCPFDVIKLPKASMNVLLPAPGTPVIPILIDFMPVFTACSWQAAIIFCATSLCAGRLLSTNVMAWLRMVVLPDVMPAIYSSTERSAGFFLKKFFMYGLMIGGCSTPSFTTNAVSGFSWHFGGHSPVVALICYVFFVGIIFLFNCSCYKKVHKGSVWGVCYQGEGVDYFTAAVFCVKHCFQRGFLSRVETCP